MSFRENLIKLRKAKNLSQDDLAEELGLSRQAISKWENENSKPDVENLIKLSKIFKVSVDDLIGNQVLETEAAAINLNYNEEKRTKKILVWIKRLIIVALILYFVNTIYRFVLLFRVTSIDKQYKELNNYHYVITNYDENGLIAKEESWFKDGISKTINTTYNESEEKEKITCIDYNYSEGYFIEKNTKTVMNKEDVILYSKSCNGKNQLYSRFPNLIKQFELLELIQQSLDSVNATININEKCLMLNLHDNYICLDRHSLCPQIVVELSDNGESMQTEQFLIEINSVKELKI